jgi:hypothetical protein
MKRLSTKRLLAVIDACSRGIYELENELDDNMEGITQEQIDSANEGLQCLYAMVNKRLIKEGKQ